MNKLRGKIVLTYELLEKIMKLPEEVKITSIQMHPENHDSNTVSIYLNSDEYTSFTPICSEGSHSPNTGGIYEEYIKGLGINYE